MTANAAKQPLAREAEEIVLATLIEFPPEDQTEPTDPLAALTPR